MKSIYIIIFLIIVAISSSCTTPNPNEKLVYVTQEEFLKQEMILCQVKDWRDLGKVVNYLSPIHINNACGRFIGTIPQSVAEFKKSPQQWLNWEKLSYDVVSVRTLAILPSGTRFKVFTYSGFGAWLVITSGPYQDLKVFFPHFSR